MNTYNIEEEYDMATPTVGIVIGDPAGIGPEVIVKHFFSKNQRPMLFWLVAVK